MIFQAPSPASQVFYSPDDIAKLLRNAWQEKDGSWRGECPAHNSTSGNSLKISQSPKGDTLLHCYAGCKAPAIVAALGLTIQNLFQAPPNGSGTTKKGRSKTGGQIRAEYDYVDEHGTLLYQNVRMEYPDGSKSFFQRRPGPTGAWINNTNGVQPVLYRLPQVLAHGAFTAVCEGEKDVETLEALGIVATTNSAGADQWKPEYAEVLRDRDIAIFEDNDEAGRRRTETIGLSFWGKALSLKVIQFPTLPPGGDVSDWVALGHTRDDLLALINAAPEWQAAADGTFGTFGTSMNWAFPENLPSGIPDVPVMPVEFIPSPLRPWLTDIAERQQVPLEFVAVPALVALGTVVGRKMGIRPKQFDASWLVIPNLWGCIVGRPGVLKSPALKAALAPLDRLIATAAERYKSVLLEGQAQLAAHEASVKAIKSAMDAAAKKPTSGGKTLAELTQDLITLEKNAPVIFTERRYRTNDSTIEKLGELFQKNPTGLLLYRDELSGWLRSLEKSGREGDREFFLEAWNGDGAFTVDRIGRGTIHIDALCLSLCGGIQPGKLQAYIADSMEGGSGDDGLMQRFQLLVWPDLDTQWTNVDRLVDGNAKNRAFGVYKGLDELLPASLGAGISTDGIPFLTFDANAQGFFNDWRADLETRLRNGSIACMALESHLAKYRSLMPSLALLFSLAEFALHPVSPAYVSRESAIMAADWCDFLEAHAKRAYAVVSSPEVSAAHALANHIREGRVNDGDSVRSIYKHHWSELDTAEKIGRALALLEEYHWLSVTEEISGGRPSEVVYLNPDLEAIL